jgi:hypothetical protein
MTHTHTHPGVAQGFFEIKFEITISRREVSKKSFSRIEKSVFEINDFFLKNLWLKWLFMNDVTIIEEGVNNFVTIP